MVPKLSSRHKNTMLLRRFDLFRRVPLTFEVCLVCLQMLVQDHACIPASVSTSNICISTLHHLYFRSLFARIMVTKSVFSPISISTVANVPRHSRSGKTNDKFSTANLHSCFQLPCMKVIMTFFWLLQHSLHSDSSCYCSTGTPVFPGNRSRLQRSFCCPAACLQTGTDPRAIYPGSFSVNQPNNIKCCGVFLFFSLGNKGLYNTTE